MTQDDHIKTEKDLVNGTSGHSRSLVDRPSKRLITRRSQVQILPPPPKKYQLRRGFRFIGGPFFASPCTKYVPRACTTPVPRARISVGETAPLGKFSPTRIVRSRLIDMAAQTLPPVVSTSALLDVHGAAERLGVTDRFIRRLVEERRIPFHKIGKLVRFDPVEVDRWIDTCRVEPRRGR